MFRMKYCSGLALLVLWTAGCGGLFADLDDIDRDGESQGICEDNQSLLGTSCGPCELDSYVCTENQIVCDGTTTCSLDETDLVVEGRHDGVQLTWDPVADATSYQIRRDGTIIAEVSGTSYLDTDAEPGTAGGPQNFQATTELQDQILLSWDGVAGDIGPEYDYEVSATSAEGAGPWSTTRSANREAPQPSSYELRIDEGEWNNIDDVTDYEIPQALLPQSG
jgi:hypothetical protein